MILKIICVLFCVSLTVSKPPLHPLSDEFIEVINSKQSLWTAGRNFHEQTPLKYLYRLTGTFKDDLKHLPRRIYTSLRNQNLPENFDARERWPHCPTLNDIRDQGSCGSCWAVAAVSAISDRVCTLSNGTRNFYFSAEDVLSCCGKRCGYGCGGGILRKAWAHYKKKGIVSGGSYNSTQGCKPYEIPPCEHIANATSHQCDINYLETPKCIRKCQEHYKVSYNKDIHQGSVVYHVKHRDIKKEIFKYGPLTSYFEVFEDFLSYKSGIYKYTAGKSWGFHSVKIIGWGVEKGVRYWLAANSWNFDWGDNGFFKIIQNKDGGCGISDNAVAGK